MGVGKISEVTSEKLQPLIVEVAEQELLSRYQCAKVMGKADGSVVTDADIAIQEALSKQLASLWPEISLLGEEMPSASQKALLNSERLWVLDPLDGTSNFASGLPYFAISLALIESGQVTCGVVYDPIRQECFRADLKGGAWLNDQPLRLSAQNRSLKTSLALIDLKRLPAQIAATIAAEPPYRSQRNFGAVALEWCWLAKGRAQLYLHGGQKLWDFAAGQLVFREAGGTVFQGAASVPRHLSLDTQPAVAAVDPGLMNDWVDWLKKTGYQF